jgi:hypothetical protein
VDVNDDAVITARGLGISFGDESIFAAKALSSQRFS